MMQTAEPGHRYNLTACYGLRPCFAAGRRSLRQREVRSVFVVVTDILVHQPPQMSFVQHYYMVEQISSTTADPTLGNAVLPRASKAGLLWLDAKALHSSDHLFTEVCSAVENQILYGVIVRERFPQLLHDPRTVWMSGNVPMQNAPPANSRLR